jgi:hypothetical protein
MRLFFITVMIGIILTPAIGGCTTSALTSRSSPAPTQLTSLQPNTESVQSEISTINFIKKVEIPSAARPEIIAFKDRVFVLYLGNISSGKDRTFTVQIYDSNMDKIIATKVLVTSTQEYGSPTDIRVATDNQFLYAFYETNKITSPTTAITYLWGAKYNLDDSFNRVANTVAPVTTSKPMSELQEGGELVDDPAPLIGPTSVFVVTRLKYSLSTTGKTIYRVREFSKDGLDKLSEFDLDLSAIADGRGRVTSLLYKDNSIYIALATTVSNKGINEGNDDGAMSDIILVKMKSDWTFDPQKDVKTLSSEPDDRENYVSGFNYYGVYFFITYKQAVAVPPGGEQIAWIKIFDTDFKLILKEKVKIVKWGPGGGAIRPSLEVTSNSIFSGQSDGLGLGKGNAEIFLYSY